MDICCPSLQDYQEMCKLCVMGSDFGNMKPKHSPSNLLNSSDHDHDLVMEEEEEEEEEEC